MWRDSELPRRKAYLNLWAGSKWQRLAEVDGRHRTAGDSEWKSTKLGCSVLPMPVPALCPEAALISLLPS